MQISPANGSLIKARRGFLLMTLHLVALDEFYSCRCIQADTYYYNFYFALNFHGRVAPTSCETNETKKYSSLVYDLELLNSLCSLYVCCFRT